MRFSREVDHRARLVLGQQLGHQFTIPNIAAHKYMPCIAIQRFERIHIAGVGKLIEIDHWLIALSQPIQNEIAADETGTTSN